MRITSKRVTGSQKSDSINKHRATRGEAKINTSEVETPEEMEGSLDPSVNQVLLVVLIRLEGRASSVRAVRKWLKLEMQLLISITTQ